MRAARARCALVALLLATLPLTAGCGLSLRRLPSAGGVAGPTYRLTAQFADAGNLTVGAEVKLRGVVIGQVEAITTRDYRAAVAMDIARGFALPRQAHFEIRFTTPLGEDYVSVTAPEQAGGPMLANGASVGVEQTDQAPTIEDTFAALSLLLNGGGLDKLQTIARELGTALHGNTGAARDMIARLRGVVDNLDAHKGDFDHLLGGMQALTARVDARRGLLATALEQFPQTIELLAEDTGQLRTLLARIGVLGDTVRGFLDRGQRAMLHDVQALAPTLSALAASRDQLIPMVDSLVRFGELFDRATPGDYLNLDITVQVLFNAPPQRPKQRSALTAPARSAAAAARSLLGGEQP